MEQRSNYAASVDAKSRCQRRSVYKAWGKRQNNAAGRVHNQAKAGGVCCRHGAKVKQCSSEGYTSLIGEEDCVLRMGQMSNNAARNGKRVMRRKEDCVEVEATEINRNVVRLTAPNNSIGGGVCWSHGAKLKAKP